MFFVCICWPPTTHRPSEIIAFFYSGICAISLWFALKSSRIWDQSTYIILYFPGWSTLPRRPFGECTSSVFGDPREYYTRSFGAHQHFQFGRLMWVFHWWDTDRMLTSKTVFNVVLTIRMINTEDINIIIIIKTIIDN